MGRKTTVWIFRETSKWNLTQEDLDMATKGKPEERNWISANSNTKQRHKNHVEVKLDKMQ